MVEGFVHFEPSFTIPGQIKTSTLQGRLPHQQDNEERDRMIVLQVYRPPREIWIEKSPGGTQQLRRICEGWPPRGISLRVNTQEAEPGGRNIRLVTGREGAESLVREICGVRWRHEDGSLLIYCLASCWDSGSSGCDVPHRFTITL